MRPCLNCGSANSGDEAFCDKECDDAYMQYLMDTSTTTIPGAPECPEEELAEYNYGRFGERGND